jgi:hypothetical protein
MQATKMTWLPYLALNGLVPETLIARVLSSESLFRDFVDFARWRVSH